MVTFIFIAMVTLPRLIAPHLHTINVAPVMAL